jgi:exosortase/archaeosortase family protein
VILLSRVSQYLELFKTNKLIHFLSFLVLFLILLFIFWLITKPINLSFIYSSLTSNILTSHNISNTIIASGPDFGLQIGSMNINILDVCTGLFELCVFLSLIFATLIVNLKSKLYGALILIFLFLFFNLVRILAMIWLLMNVNIYVVDVLHTILFKIGFFIFFILFYYIWLNISKRNNYFIF